MVSINANIIITYFLAFIVVIHSCKYRGLYKTLLLFFGICIIGGGLENLNVIFGCYDYSNSNLTWLWGKCPFEVIAGWYVILYCSSYMAHSLIGQFDNSFFTMGIGSRPSSISKNFIKITVLRAALAGFIGVSLDFIMDPVAVANQWWIWKVHNIYILGVPLSNFLGWWLLIFFTALFYDMIISYCGVKEKKNCVTSGMWIAGIITASITVGLIIDGFTIWWGMEGVRTHGMNTCALNASITPERVSGLIWTTLMVMAAVAGIMACSLLSFDSPKHRPTSHIWHALPAAVMLVFWGLMMVIAALTP